MDVLAVEISACRQHLINFGRKRWKHLLTDEDIEDVAQETITSALKSRDTFRGDAKLITWLIAIYKIKAIMQLRQVRESVPIDLVAPNPEAEDQLDVPSMTVDASQEVDYATNQETARIHAAIEALPDDFRVIVRLHYFGEMPSSQLAAHFGVPEGTIKSRLFHARQKLRAALV